MRTHDILRECGEVREIRFGIGEVSVIAGERKGEGWGW